MMESLQNCRIFLSDDGYIGIAPQNAQVGDILARLERRRSEPMYIILRAAQDDHWRLISGDCHAEGVDGEVPFESHGDSEELILS